LLCSAAPGAPFIQLKIFNNSRALPHPPGGSTKADLMFSFCQKDLKNRQLDPRMALLMRRRIQRIVVVTLQAFLSAQLELTRAVSPCELKQTS
jgi:hypothetical protein